jgi:PmbA protein
MQYETLPQELVERCLRRGADAAEVFLETNRQLSLTVRNGEMETVQESAATGSGFRVFADGRMGFAHSNDLSDGAVDQAIAAPWPSPGT